jgi:hypothetical protein
MEKAYGCAVFALRNGVAFLRDSEFFNKIKIDATTTLKNDMKLHRITRLPAASMVPAQSMSLLDAYIQCPDNDLNVVGKNKSLKDYMNTHVITVKGKRQNHYTSTKIIKYMDLVMKALESQKPEEVDTWINRAWIA